MGVPDRKTEMAGTITKALHLSKDGSLEKQWPSLSNLNSQGGTEPPPSVYNRLGTRRKRSLDEVALQQEITAGLGGSGGDNMRKTSRPLGLGPQPGSMDELESTTTDIDKAMGQSTILSKLLRERNKSLDELSIGSDCDTDTQVYVPGALSRRRTLLNLSSACGSYDDDDDEDMTPDEGDLYSKSYGGESSTKYMDTLFNRRMRSLDEPSADPTSPHASPAPGRFQRKPTLADLHLDVAGKGKGRPTVSSSMTPNSPEDTVHDGGGGPGQRDVVRELVQTPGADILQVLILHTDRQLQEHLSKEEQLATSMDLPDAGAENSEHKVSDGNRTDAPIPGSRLSHLTKESNLSKPECETPSKVSPRTPRAPLVRTPAVDSGTCTPHAHKAATPGVQMRRSGRDLRRSIKRRTKLDRDELYEKVNAAITPKRLSSGYFEFPTPRSRASGGHFSYDINSPIPRTPLYLNGAAGSAAEEGLLVNMPPPGTLSEGEAAHSQTPGGASAISQTPLEHKIGRYLRARGDALADDCIQTAFAPVVTEILRDATYRRFQEVIQQTLGQQPSWCQVAGLVNVARSAVAWAGYGTNAALRVKESTLRYFEDHLSTWVLVQGGWESMVDGCDVEPLEDEML